MSAAPPTIDLLEELRWRGLLHQCTDEAGLAEHLAQAPRRIYCGFDPTADSLTIGNLVPIMVLVHAARSGHEPVVVMGGGTGLIGDPSGKSAERALIRREQIEANVRAQRPIFSGVFRGAGLGEPTILNNLEWLSKVSFLDALRDVGKHFSVNQMIQRDSVRDRLHGREQGISYTEFSYMILQALDFAHLHLTRRVTVQCGGSDQWGNIVSGIDLIRRLHVELPMSRQLPPWLSTPQGQAVLREELERRAAAFGFTAPLVTKADGGKFGKTEAGAVWLSAHRTSPYDYYQFWLNTADADVERFLKLFTLMDRPAIEDLIARHHADPAKRLAQQALAEQATTILHGSQECQAVVQASRALFAGDLSSLSLEALQASLAEAPSIEMPRQALAQGVALVDLLVASGLASSKREAREFLAAGAIRVNGSPADAAEPITEAHLLHDRLTVLKRGKKKLAVVRWVDRPEPAGTDSA
ncbi:MAG: tyrosine--tRNA ligase [Phycisphaerales bacterium]|nr:MAG: tyrosine--tRNA ligase [Phycisphaerales bacterium]